MKKRVGERIEAEISEYYANEVLLPTARMDYDQCFHEMILLNKAHAVMLAEERIIEKEAAGKILDGLDQVFRELKRQDLDGAYEELYFNVQKALFDRIGIETGGKLHTGRSRNDLYATLYRMVIRRTLWEVMERVIKLQETLVSAAEKDMDTIITGYTHRMPAQPITVGHFCLGACDALHRDFTRLKAAYQCTNLSPYGSAALAGTGFPINRERQSELLGFEKVLVNTLDGVGSRDFILEAAGAFSIMMTNLSRVAQDLYVWSNDEYGVYVPGAPVSLISSIMPQKKNPDSLEMVEGKTAHALGSFVSAFSAIKNTPFSFSQDLQEAVVMYWEGHAQTVQALGLLSETIKCSKFNTERALHLAKNNFSTVTALADYLVRKCKIPFWQAHDIVGGMVRKVCDDGTLMAGMNSRLLSDVSRQVFQLDLQLSEQEIQDCLDPYKNVQSKISAGSPSRKSVENMLLGARGYLEEEKGWLQDEKERVERAYRMITDSQAVLSR
jgi:argininosuccinate lyase